MRWVQHSVVGSGPGLGAHSRCGCGHDHVPSPSGEQRSLQSKPRFGVPCVSFPATRSVRDLMLYDWSAHCSHEQTVKRISPMRNAWRWTSTFSSRPVNDGAP